MRNDRRLSSSSFELLDFLIISQLQLPLEGSGNSRTSRLPEIGKIVVACDSFYVVVICESTGRYFGKDSKSI